MYAVVYAMVVCSQSPIKHNKRTSRRKKVTLVTVVTVVTFQLHYITLQ